MHIRIALCSPPLVAALLAAQSATAQGTSKDSALSGLQRSFQSFNPDVSAIVDMYYHADDSEEGISHILEEMSGFGHVHSGEEHHHHGPDEGFNLRHLELQFSADVDPYFKGSPSDLVICGDLGSVIWVIWGQVSTFNISHCAT